MANLSGTSGNDTLVGTAGDDTLDVRAASAGVTVNFADGTVDGGFNGTFVNMERALGSNGATC